MLELARRLHQEAADGLLATKATRRAQEHHRYLAQASAALYTALAQPEVDLALVTLRAAYADLERASHSLPGFEMVSFEHACCTKIT
jgi:hypothetical protein